jgi:tryptophanase
MIRTFDFPEDARMLPCVLHQNNLLRPDGGHAEKLSILEQLSEFPRYIWACQQVMAPLASQVGTSAASMGSCCQDDGYKPKEVQNKSQLGQQKRSY